MVTEYRAGWGSRLFVFVVFAGLVALGIGFWLPDVLPHSIGFNQRRMIALVVIAIAVLLIGYLAFVHMAVKVRVTPQGLEVYRGPRLVGRYPRGTHYHAEITHQSRYGLKTNTVRGLIADPYGQAKRIYIPNISREKFNDLYSRLEPLEVPGSTPNPAVAAMPPPTGPATSYAIPPAPSAPAPVPPVQASFAPRSQWAGARARSPSAST